MAIRPEATSCGVAAKILIWAHPPAGTVSCETWSARSAADAVDARRMTCVAMTQTRLRSIMKKLDSPGDTLALKRTVVRLPPFGEMSCLLFLGGGLRLERGHVAVAGVEERLPLPCGGEQRIGNLHILGLNRPNPLHNLALYCFRKASRSSSGRRNA